MPDESPLPTSRTLRQVLAGDHCVTASSVFDPISAKIAHALGFEVGVMGGSVASHAVLGAPDLILITLTELVEQARRACRAAPVRLIVDADHGYGNALNVMRTVEELQAAGVAGIAIEDTLLPRAFGSGPSPQLISPEEGVGKMTAALRARGGGPALILGRTNAASTTGVEDAIRRLKAYEDVGVDGLFVPGLRSRDELERIARELRLPLVLGGADPSLADPDFLAAHGVRVLLRGHQPFAAAVKALYDAMRAVSPAGTTSPLDAHAPDALLRELLGTSRYAELTRDLLGQK